MNTPELLIISGYPAHIDDIRHVCVHLNIVPRLMEWERANQELLDVLAAKFLAEGLPDVIISRGAVADLVEHHFADTVVLRAEPDDVDLLEALALAGRVGNKVGFLMYGPRAADFKTETVRHILGLEELRVYPVCSKLDIEQAICHGRDAGLDAMVGGGRLGKRTGEALNIPVVFAETSRRSARTAVEQAMAIIEARRSEKRQLRSFKAVVGAVQEGIMTLSGQRIILVNSTLSAMLGLPEKGTDAACVPLGGQPLTLEDLAKVEPALHTFLHNKDTQESILAVGNQTLFCRKVPLSDSADSGEVMLICRNITDIQQQERKIRKELHAKGLVARFHFTDIIGKSAALLKTLEKARIFAATDATLLIHGASGTGKELFAQSVHNASPRSNRPFVAVNCAAIPENLLESELFGYEEGAFSGAARNGKVGLFELAHEGTIFLDEIDSLSLGLQAVLLRVIQEKQVRRVGSRSLVSIDTRILSATNRPLDRFGQTFRADLYYRLNTLNLRVPPLAERREDLLLLAEHFLAVYAKRYGMTVPLLSGADRTFILTRVWAGNVREIENLMHRHVVLSTGGSPRSVRDSLDEEANTAPERPVPELAPVDWTRSPASLPLDTFPMGTLPSGDPLPGAHAPHHHAVHDALSHLEQTAIRRVLDEEHWNRGRAAARLGISRATLWRKMKQWRWDE